jgi:hypothetical protein
MSPSRRRHIGDSLRSAYGEWKWRSAAVWAAYERWTHGGGNLEFASYRVALDLEERACRRYMEIARQA